MRRVPAAALAERVSTWSDDRLGQLLHRRPDLCHPPVPDLMALTARAGTQASTLRALESLDLPRLAVLAAVAAQGPGAATTEQVTAHVRAPSVEPVRGLLTDLESSLLVVGDDAGWSLPVSVANAVPGSEPAPADRPLPLAPPVPQGRAVPAALRRNAALAAVGALLRAVSALLLHLEATAGGLATLRTGGVGVRELRRLAAALDSAPEDTAWLLELAAASGLITLDPDTSTWRPHRHRDWLRADRPAQWAALTAGWLSAGRAPLAGPLEGPALAADRQRPDAPRLRTEVLGAAAAVDGEHPGTRLTEAVRTRLHWATPRRAARVDRFTLPLLQEAGLLGLTGADALTPVGALVAAGDLEGATAALAASLPAPERRMRLQGDLTAVVPGFPDPDMDRSLRLMADTESDGSAHVYRFSESSLHRALEAGMGADQITAFLAEHSEDAVPQSLAYLVRDVARRHGALAVGTGAWLRTEDEATLEALLADPALEPAGLERIAPTVAVAGVGIDQQELHRLLAAAGHPASRHAARPASTPEPTATAGTTRPGAADPSPAPGATPEQAPEPTPAVDLGVTVTRWAPSEEEVAAQVARLRVAPRPEPRGEGTEEAVAVLRLAARHRETVELTTVDRQGARRTQRVVPLAVASGRLRALVEGRDLETVVPLHRVVSAVTGMH